MAFANKVVPVEEQETVIQYDRRNSTAILYSTDSTVINMLRQQGYDVDNPKYWDMNDGKKAAIKLPLSKKKIIIRKKNTVSRKRKINSKS